MEYQTKILIADENEEARRTLKSNLLAGGYVNVTEASNGEEAMSMIRMHAPEIVITDIWLSKLDGISLIRNCRSTMTDGGSCPAFTILSGLNGDRPRAISSALTNSWQCSNSGSIVYEAVVLPAPLHPAMI